MIIDKAYIISKTETKNIEIIKEGFLKVTGILNGNIDVNCSGELLITGIVNGDIHINKDSKAIVTGIVNGKIVNRSKLKVSGIINEQIFNLDDGECIIEKDSIVNGVKY